MKTDGSIIIDTKIIDGGMEKGFELIKDEMSSVGMSAKKVGEQIELSFSKMDVSKPIEEALGKVQALQKEFAEIDTKYQAEVQITEDLEAELAKVKSILSNQDTFTSPNAYIDAYMKQGELTDAVEKQKSVVDSLQEKWKAVNSTLEASEKKLTETLTKEINKQAAAEEKAAKQAQRAAEKKAAAEKRAQEKQYRDATKGARRFNSRLREIVSGALVFNLISAGLRSVTRYFGSALKSNKEFATSFSQLKGALLTAFQPIYEVIAPAIIYMMRLLTAAAQAVGQFFARISGKSYSEMQKNAESLYNEANAIDAVGGAAKEAKKQLMGFDEINKLESADAAGGGGSAGNYAPDFTAMEDPQMKGALEDILRLVGAVGAALLTWKIASAFTDNLQLASGLALSVGGAFLYATSWADAFTNGIDWGNLTGMLVGVAAVAGGLYLAFGSVAAGVALIITGVGLAIVSLKEWIETGELSNEACVALVGGIMAIGAAISLFTGSWIPLVIAGVASAVLAIWNYWDEIKAWAQNIGAKLAELAQMVRDFFANAINNIIESVVNGWNSFWSGITGGGGGTGGTSNYSASSRAAVYSATPDVPHLAKGAVIPANNKFLAVLGDQTSGRNLEAPEDLIRQIVREESGAGNSDRVAQLLEALISVVEGIEVGDEVIGKAAARYNRSTARARGY